MGTSVYWIIPAFYQLTKSEKLRINLTEFVKTFLENRVWERGYEYGFNTGLENTNPNDIKSAWITIYPVITEGIVYGDRITTLLSSQFGKLSRDNTKILEKSNLLEAKGVAIFEVNYDFNTKEIPLNRKDLEMDFVHSYHRFKAVCDELGAFFRCASHLTFHCEYVIMPSMKTEPGGLLYIKSKRRKYLNLNSTTEFSYPVIIQEDKLHSLKDSLKVLSSIWHYNLWPLRRFNQAFNSEYVEMENFLDLLFALEGLFDKDTSVDTIKIACATLLSDSKKDALKIIDTLTASYKMRNQIVHGGKTFTGMEEIKIGGETRLSQSVFWDLKMIVTGVMILAIKRLRMTEGMKNLRITLDEILENYYA